MASKREQVLQAVFARLVAALPYADVSRNAGKPRSVPPGGWANMRDGDPGNPTLEMSPLAYNYEHRIGLEVAAPNEGTLDALLEAIDAAVTGDPFLGGLCQFMETEAATIDDLEVTGADDQRWADTAIVASYATSSPNT